MASSFREIIDLFPSRKRLAEGLGVKRAAIDLWMHRDSIPPQHFNRIVELAKRRPKPRQVEVTHELLMAIHDRRRTVRKKP